jgi:hypothetical protein
MTSQSLAGILGAIVAAIVLAAAFYYVPVGRKAPPPKVEQPVAAEPATPAAPAPRGPVIREVPN